jgi:quercetin dioxygenase-like cupin family protein
MILVIGCCAIMLAVGTVMAADPDPLQDFCVADLSTNAPLVNGFACRPRSTVSAKDFVYKGFRAPSSDVKLAPTGAIAAVATPVEFPGINTQGITHARLDFDVGGVVPLHTHPRASETLFVLKGSIYTGFVSDDNVLYASTLEKGDLILFPRGLLHFQLNVGKESAITFNSLTSQNPGLLLTANQIFTPNITISVIEKSFGVDAATAKLLKGSYPGHP